MFKTIRHAIHTTDKLILCLCLLLSGFSCVVLYAVHHAGYIRLGVVTTQAMIALFGAAAAVVVSLIDMRMIAKLWPAMLGISLVLCGLLLTPLGYMPPGSDDLAWLRFGSFSFQPSEVVKITFIYTFALHLEHVKDAVNRLGNFLLLCAHGMAYFVLIMFQGDFGSASVFLAIFVVMIFAAGLSWRLIFAGLAAAAAAVPLMWHFVLPDYLRRRFYVAWNPALDPLGDGYQQYRGQIALGSGQLTGRGLFSDSLMFVPEGHNDFIFASIGQVFGFIGCALTVFGLTLLCAKILLTARKARGLLGRYLCCGVFAVVCYQAVVNIGMVLCVIPVIGITLPFISGGGSSLLVSFLGIGMVMGVARDAKKEYMFQ